MKKTIAKLLIALLLTVSSGVVLAGPLEDEAKTLLEAMPCRAWTIMHDNNFSGQDCNKIQVETWTIRYQRDYFRRSVERMKKDEPEKGWQNVDGADVDDRQILNWITGCQTNIVATLNKLDMFVLQQLDIANSDKNIHREN